MLANTKAFALCCSSCHETPSGKTASDRLHAVYCPRRDDMKKFFHTRFPLMCTPCYKRHARDHKEYDRVPVLLRLYTVCPRCHHPVYANDDELRPSTGEPFPPVRIRGQIGWSVYRNHGYFHIAIPQRCIATCRSGDRCTHTPTAYNGVMCVMHLQRASTLTTLHCLTSLERRMQTRVGTDIRLHILSFVNPLEAQRCHRRLNRGPNGGRKRKRKRANISCDD